VRGDSPLGRLVRVGGLFARVKMVMNSRKMFSRLLLEFQLKNKKYVILSLKTYFLTSKQHNLTVSFQQVKVGLRYNNMGRSPK